MERWLGKHEGSLYAVMRIIAGFLFACHGLQKVFGLFGGRIQLGNPIMFGGGIIELVAGILMALGLWTGYAAFIASGEMAVGYFWRHAGGGFLPIVNKGELAVVDCFMFLYMAARGSGPWSVDALMKKRQRAILPGLVSSTPVNG